MPREILTYPITTEQIEEELRFFIDYMIARGISDGDILFGSAWGIDYYTSPDWEEERIPLDQLLQKVGEAATLGWGGLGNNDLFVTLPDRDIQFLFCHVPDIHITFSEPVDITRFFFDRWQDLGYMPREFLKEPTDS